MPPPVTQTYEFDLYRIDTGERLLRRGDNLISLPPKVADTLLVLLRSAGRMVEKGELMKAVWPDTFVEEGALTRNISLLRKAFGDGEESPSFIETIPKRGYRFVLPVRVAALDAQTALIAVLAFRSLGDDASQQYLAEGLAHALVTQLAHVRSLRVISLTSDPHASVSHVISTERAITHTLCGTVLRADGQVRIDAQLTDACTRTVAWADSYERDFGDVLTLAGTIAENIAAEVRARLTAEDRYRMQQRSIHPAALDAYLRGRYSWNLRTEEGLRRAARYFQQAIDADPADPLPYAGLADSYALLGSLGTDGMPPKEAMPKAKAAAQKAVDLGPELADGHVSLAYVRLSYDWDVAGAEREFSRALELNPRSAIAHHWYSHLFMAKGDLGRATEHMREALRLEPLSRTINIGVGWCYFYSRQYENAIEQFRSVTEIDPNLPLARLTLGMALEQSGALEAASAQYEQAKELSRDSPLSVTALAGVLARLGRGEHARRQLDLLESLSATRYVPALYFAAVYQAMGERRKSAEWAWKAVEERCDYFMYLRVDPRAGKLASRPEFIRILAALRPAS